MDLESKYQKYLQYLPLVQDSKTGFIEHHGCDALLFTSLVGCVPEVTVGIMAAFDKKTGMWHRRPTATPCFDCKTKTDTGSKSTISRDMLLGLAWYAWHNRRLDISEQVIKYAMSNWGFMGCAIDKKVKWGRCQIMPSLFSTFCWISHKLGGPSRAWARWIPADLGHKGLDDFQAHLQVLHILLRSKITDKISKNDKKVLKYHADRQPKNPLFLYTVGKTEQAKFWLMNETWWPENRLPTSRDRKAQWLPMRDESTDWLPDISKNEIHSGGDFLFVAALVLEKI